jgi:hypothetical protein
MEEGIIMKYKIGDICYYRGYLAKIPKYVLIVDEVREGLKEMIFLEDGYRFVGKELYLLPLDFLRKIDKVEEEEA